MENNNYDRLTSDRLNQRFIDQISTDYVCASHWVKTPKNNRHNTFMETSVSVTDFILATTCDYFQIAIIIHSKKQSFFNDIKAY